MESSYLELQCSSITTDCAIVPLNGTLLNRISYCGGYIEACPEVPKGTFQGMPFQNNNSTFRPTSTWSIAIDAFISSAYWPDRAYTISANTTDPTFTSSQATLLFQANNVQNGMYTNPRTNKTHTYCSLKTSYVESRINCTSSVTSSEIVVPSPSPSLRSRMLRKPFHISHGPASSGT